MEPPPVEPDEPLEEDELPGADPESMVRDFGSHPMMHRIQDALYKQLQREYERTTLEMREKETEVTAERGYASRGRRCWKIWGNIF